MQVLIVHGWQGSGPDHWQSWLAGRLAATGDDVRYPALPDADDPWPAAWDGALSGELAGMREDLVVVCHSLGCALWLRAAAAGIARAARVALVAPPAPDCGIAEVARFHPTGATAECVRAAGSTRVVCADDDPYCPAGAAAVYGEALELPVDPIPGGGHLNSEAGYGPWPAIEAWVRGTAPRVLPR